MSNYRELKNRWLTGLALKKWRFLVPTNEQELIEMDQLLEKLTEKERQIIDAIIEAANEQGADDNY